MPNKAMLVPRTDPVKLLLDRMPEFGARLDTGDLDLPYVVFGFFAQYLLDLSEGDPILDRAVAFLNELAETGDPELENLVQVSVFESIAGEDRSVRIKRGLRDKAARLFLSAQNLPGAM